MKTLCYLYKTRSGWHWEVKGKNWNLSNRTNLGDDGYSSRSGAISAANKICEKFGLLFEIENDKQTVT